MAWRDPARRIVPFDLLETARNTGSHLKNSTKNRQFLTPIRAVLNHAYQRRWCSYTQIKSLKEEAPKEKAPATTLWLHLFFRQCERDDAQHVAALVMFMAHTGARVSEAIRLEWQDVDLQCRTAVLVKTKTETNSERHMTDELVARLYALQHRKGYRNPERVFHYRCRWSVNDRIRRICERAEIEYKSSHACGRVTYATMAIAMGLDVPTAMKGGGWKSSAIFLGRYAKPGRDAGRRVAERFNRLQYDRGA